jgi:hypothetical protein
MRAPDGRLPAAAALGLGLVLLVVVAAAGIRLETGIEAALRPVHRLAASLEVLVVLWLGWMAWRVRIAQPAVYRAVLLAMGITVVLSVIGIAAGQQPPSAAAAANLLGGLALAAVFAWLLGLSSRGGAAAPALAAAIGVLLAIQISLGARLAIVSRAGDALPAHALLAIALAALLAWFGLARVRGAAGKALFVLALAAPVAGFTALQYDHSAGAALVHAAIAALLLAAAAYALGRGA